jgi:3-oxoacyl-[acyl-carrier-protein] synthase II
MNTIITAWETLSPLGWNAEEHSRNALEPASDQGSGPRMVPGFEVRQALGVRGTRSMCRATGLAVATTGRLLSRAALDVGARRAYADEEIGIVLATSDNVQALSDFNRDSWIRSRPYDVDPAQAPVLLMNVHAGQCAIWHRLRGPNSTICGSHLGFLLALSQARRIQRRGHARAVVCGAVEEYSASRAALADARGGESRRPLGEGCVMFLLELGDATSTTGPAHGEVLATEFGFAPREDAVQTVLAACLRRGLAKAGVGPAQVAAVAPSPAIGARGHAEESAIRNVFGGVPLLRGAGDALGDTHAVSGAFQLIEALAGTGAAGVAGVTATDAEGRVGCVLIRVT